MEKSNKATYVVLSGDMDKIFAAFILASGAAAAGMDTTLFFTFWGLNAIRKDQKTGSSFMGKMMGRMNKGGLHNLDPSKFKFGGMGKKMFRNMMKKKGVSSLEELRQMCIDLDVHFLACGMSMDVMEIKREDLIDEVEEIVGVARAIKDANESSIQMFI